MLTITYGTDYENMTYEALVTSDISQYLRANFFVAIKPNLVVSRPASLGATTHPEIVAGIIRYLLDFGVKSTQISIIESSWLGDDTRLAFKNCGYEPVCKKFGITFEDLKSDACEKREFAGVAMQVCRSAIETDFLINVPVLKAHSQTKMTCNLKNLKGCIPDSEKRRFHTIGLHTPIAALNGAIKTGYCVVDGICGDLSFEEGGNPSCANRIIVGRNPVTVDSFCAKLIGYAPDEIEHLRLAKDWGIGDFFTPDMPVTELFAENKPQIPQALAKRLAARFERNISQDGACSACYAALISALHVAGEPHGKICIGQNFRGKTNQTALGIGSCTSKFSSYVPGCPPTAAEIVRKLKL